MSSEVQRLLSIVAGVFDVILLVVLLRKRLQAFLLLLFYVAVDLVSVAILTTLDVILQGSREISKGSSLSPGQVVYAHVYWSFEIAQDLLLFLMVIVFTYRATEGSPLRPAARNLLTCVVGLVLLLPFFIFRPIFDGSGPWPTGVWFSSTTQLLNFGAALMNLVLWTALIATKRRDPQLLTISLGLGVMVTGVAVSRGFRRFIPLGTGFRWVSGTLVLLTHVFALIVWCWAFRSVAKQGEAPRDVLSSA